MKQLIEKASEGIVKRCEKLYTEIKKVQASLPRGGYETDFNLVNDPEIRGTMRRNEVNYNDAVCMVHEKPLWEDSFDHAWDSPISGYAIEEIRDDIKEHVAELQDYAD
ncbi:hypothetical protein IWQ62_005240 [Dispira parvispora]|uniref:Uncharacterized protein n=1 Tax=Dispira parvispora TaxID=1520584 RepID=A0A9W8E5E9_9FUNG|nr:hypothetical protein IWQ62_005240 [Dispira parvispora]